MLREWSPFLSAPLSKTIVLLESESRPALSDSETSWTVAHQAPLSVGLLQVKLLEWVAMPFSRGSSQSKDRSQVSHIAGGFFTV